MTSHYFQCRSHSSLLSEPFGAFMLFLLKDKMFCSPSAVQSPLEFPFSLSHSLFFFLSCHPNLQLLFPLTVYLYVTTPPVRSSSSSEDSKRVDASAAIESQGWDDTACPGRAVNQQHTSGKCVECDVLMDWIYFASFVWVSKKLTQHAWFVMTGNGSPESFI